MSDDILAVIKTLVIGRLVEPASELHTWEWARTRSAVYELVGKPATAASLTSLYRAGDRLLLLKDEIERHLTAREKDLFALTEKMFFFDLTNTYCEGAALANPKAKYGRSKEKRSDCKIITPGLIIDEMGFPKSTRVFEGNKSEPLTLGLRPNFHQKEQRADAHLFISVLAYHILNIVEYRLRAAGIHASWARVRNMMSTHERITISFKTRAEDGNVKNQFIRLNSRLTPDQLEIYRILKLSPVPLPRKKLSPKGVVTTLFDNS